MRTAEDLLAAAERLEANLRAIRQTGAEWAYEVELLASRIERREAKRGEFGTAEWLRRVWSAEEAQRVIDTIRLRVRTGEIDRAEQCAASFELHWRHAEQLVLRYVASKGRKRSEGPDQTHNRALRRERTAEWDRWNRTAAEIWKKHPHRGAPAVAARVRDELKIADAVDTIRKRLRKAGTTG